MSKSQEGLYELILLDGKKEEIWLGGNENKNRLRVQAERWSLGEAIVLVVPGGLPRTTVERLKIELWRRAAKQAKKPPLLIVSPVEFKFLRVVKIDEKDKPEDNKIKENSG